MSADSLEKGANEIKRQPPKLRENADKLKESIKVWQAWEAEYEDLREELQNLGDNASSHSIDEVGSQCTGELLNQKEINLLIRDERKRPRTCQQTVGLLSRRIDYVQNNIKSLQGSLQADEDKEAASQPCNQAQQKNDDDYPLMEIQEELDENDNVLSSSMTPASEAAPQVIEALKKAGIPGLQPAKPDTSHDRESKRQSDGDQVTNHLDAKASTVRQLPCNPPDVARNQQRSPSTSESDTWGDSRNSGRRRKSVTFADGTKQAAPTPTQPRSARERQAAKAANAVKVVKAEFRGSIDTLKKVHDAGFIDEEVFDHFRRDCLQRRDNLLATVSKQPAAQRQSLNNKQPRSTANASTKADFDPIIPSQESAEDAALRREMIRYNMNEIGAVVAEIDLDEDSSQENSGQEIEQRSSSDEDENSWGISTASALTSDYVKEMQALARKLDDGSKQPAESSTTIEALLQAEDDLVVGEDGNPVKKDTNESNRKQEKTVRFANDLDIDDRPSSLMHNSQSQGIAPKRSNPANADVVERRVEMDSSPKPTSTLKKRRSQFKAARTGEAGAALSPKKPSHLQLQASSGNLTKTPSLPAFTPPATPKPTPIPPGRTHASTVIERPFTSGTSTENVSEPDRLDASLLQQELTMEYHRTRNQMIQRQGGFLGDYAEGEEGPLVDEEGKKVSRFKAARLKGLEG
ncbi:MAG: hypothetical protein Q9219_000092 [cf. Caloplaca sp. 3 TL-2023]